MAAFSDIYYLQKYSDALAKPENVEKLVKLLNSPKTVFNDTLLVKLGVVTSTEWREIEDSSRGGRLTEKKARITRNLIEKVRTKHKLMAYRGLRKFIAKQVAPDQMGIIEEVFPFGAEEDQAGLAPQIVCKVAQQSAVLPAQSATPCILWITSNRTEFGDAKKLLNALKHETREIPSQCNLFLEKLTVPLPDCSLHNQATVFLACPRAELSGPDPFRSILMNFSPRPHFALLSCPCDPLPETELTQHGKMGVVVVTSKVPSPIEGEVQYSTELWRLKGEFKEVCVSFGGASRTMDRHVGCTIHCPKAFLFYAAAKQVEGLKYLAVARVHKENAVSVDPYYLYVYNILQVLS